MLEKNGYTVIQKNFRCRNGEIDIIARKGRVLVFVEVKGRANNNFGNSIEFVDKKKKKRITQCIKFFLLKNRYEDFDIRFDIIGFDKGNPIWIKNELLEE